MFGKRLVPVVVGCLLCLVTAASAQQTDAPSATSSLQIGEHRFGLDVVEREVAKEIDTFHIGDVVYLWLRVEGGPADPITVTWFSGDVSYDVELSIGSSSWRTWARKTLFRAGPWSVQVKDSNGAMLFERTLEVLETARSEAQ